MRRRDWSAVAPKRVAAACRICGRPGGLEAAHTIGRGRDVVVGQVAHVHADDVVMLCGPTPQGCHGAYDRGEVDLYPRLTVAELRAAVKAAGAPGGALRRLSAPLWGAERRGDRRAGAVLDARLAELEALVAAQAPARLPDA